MRVFPEQMKSTRQFTHKTDRTYIPLSVCPCAEGMSASSGYIRPGRPPFISQKFQRCFNLHAKDGLRFYQSQVFILQQQWKSCKCSRHAPQTFSSFRVKTAGGTLQTPLKFNPKSSSLRGYPYRESPPSMILLKISDHYDKVFLPYSSIPEHRQAILSSELITILRPAPFKARGLFLSLLHRNRHLSKYRSFHHTDKSKSIIGPPCAIKPNLTGVGFTISISRPRTHARAALSYEQHPD